MTFGPLQVVGVRTDARLVSSNDAVALTADGSVVAPADRRPRRLLWAGIVLAWLAISVGAAALGVIGTVVVRLAWSLSECLGTPCPPKGDPPGLELLLLGAAIAVPAILVAGLVAFAPTRRTYAISAGAGAMLLAVLVAARLQAGMLALLPALLGATLTEPVEVLAYVITQMPDVVLASGILVASLVARRRTAPAA